MSLMRKLAEWIRRDRQRNLDKFRECFDSANSTKINPDGSAGGYAPGRMGNADLTLHPVAAPAATAASPASSSSSSSSTAAAAAGSE
jgi:hypothetical protein